MARFFLEPESWGDHAELVGDEAVHCSRVLRAKEGDVIEVFDGAGRWARAEITSVDRNRVSLRLSNQESCPKPAVHVVLAQAILKGKAMDWLVQKSVELGVSSIQPLITEHTVVRPAEAKAEKWRRTALEACKQSGQRFLPEIGEPTTLKAFLENNHPGLSMVAALAEPRKLLREVVAGGGAVDHVTFVVGPEGDLSASELDALMSHGFEPASLGNQVLRSETAALFGLAAIAYVFA